MVQVETGRSIARVHRTLTAEARRLRASRARLASARESLALPADEDAGAGDPATLLAGAIDCTVHEQLTHAIETLEQAVAESGGAPGDRSRGATDGGREPLPPIPGARTRSEEHQPGGRL